MAHRWLSRALLCAGIVAMGISGAGAAWALNGDGATVPVQESLPVVAATFGTTDCGAGGPYPDQDVWNFRTVVAPDGVAAAFVAVTLTFLPATGEGPALPATGEGPAREDPDPTERPATPALKGSPLVRNIGADSFETVGAASVRTPSGWTLVSAVAEVTGDAPAFRLASTCPARAAIVVEQSTPTPGASSAKTTAPPVRRTPRPLSVGPQATPVSVTTPPAILAAPRSVSKLPTTGTDISGMFALGITMVAAGVLLLIVRRRRIAPAVVEVDDASLIWIATTAEYPIIDAVVLRNSTEP